MAFSDEEMSKFMNKYKKKLDDGLGKKITTTKNDTSSDLSNSNNKSLDFKSFTKTYEQKKEIFYEKCCNFSEKVLKLKPDKKDIKELDESIKISHLKITPSGVVSFSILGPLFLVFAVLLITFVLPILLGNNASFFLVGLFLLISLILVLPLKKIPYFMANTLRLKASNQMVLAVFYIVTYMRHTSNLELAINFASERLSPPLSYDLKKVLWDVETEKYGSVKEALDIYLETWKKWNREFIESMHLIESSLYEPTEDRRISALEKALDVILEETYEKMLHYAHDLQSPLTMLHMLGVVLPILGLVILPLAVSFVGGIEWYHIAVIYNLVLPVSVYYLGKNILSQRPTGYGDVDISKDEDLNKLTKIKIKFGKKNYFVTPLYLSIFIFAVLLIIGISPLLVKVFLSNEQLLAETDIMPGIKFFDYRNIGGTLVKLKGPYGLGAGILSLFVTCAFGLGIGIYYKLRSKNVIKIREETKKLEKEFASALFQLGNRLGDGIPAEIAFSKVAEIMEGTSSGRFFKMTSLNIQKLGMSVEDAIFNRKTGSLKYYPSPVIESGMKVLTESSKKGPKIASLAIMNVSKYIKQIHKVNERLKDLMSDIISNMKSQISFLTPAIAGIVIGITSMITTILGALSKTMSGLQDGASASANSMGPNTLISFGEGIPSFYFQIIVGLYVVQIVFILTELVNGIENGSDTLQERFLKGLNLVKSTTLYVVISFVVILLFNLIAASILSSMTF